MDETEMDVDFNRTETGVTIVINMSNVEFNYYTGKYTGLKGEDAEKNFSIKHLKRFEQNLTNVVGALCHAGPYISKAFHNRSNEIKEGRVATQMRRQVRSKDPYDKRKETKILKRKGRRIK
jgi:hypothetical protein